MKMKDHAPMQDSLLHILRCPYCGSAFTFHESRRPERGAGQFGVLTCKCAKFPVVDDIPIIQRGAVGMFEHTGGRAEVDGVNIGELVNLIEAGRPLQALLHCLTVPVSRPFMQRLGWRLSRHLSRYIGMRRLSARILSTRSTIDACDLFEFFYRTGGPLNPDVAHYFIQRFAQPRHLAALALVANVALGDKPVLDIACGAGHLAHYLTRRASPVPAVGTDMNFFQLWIARFWIAPAAHFVCANAADGLPFADDSFSASICSDAYHYVPKRKGLVGEIARVAPGAPVILTRLGNRAVMPNEGAEQTLQGYLDEFGDVSASVFTESALMKDYLRQRNPLAGAPMATGQLEDCKWLSFVWNASGKIAERSDDETDWPHAVGDLGLNPIYTRSVTAAGDVQLRFEFPSVWYAYENHEMLSYHPRRAIVTRAQIEMLQDPRSDPSVAALVESFILLGLPHRFHADRAPNRA